MSMACEMGSIRYISHSSSSFSGAALNAMGKARKAVAGFGRAISSCPGKIAQMVKGKETRATQDSPVQPMTGSPVQSTVSEEIPLKKRAVCALKTAGTFFLKTAISVAVGGQLMGTVGGLALGVVTGAIVSLPVAIPAKLIDLCLGTRLARLTVLGGAVLGGLAGGLTGSVLSTSVALIGGIGLGLASGVYGLIRGIKDASAGDFDRMVREKETLKDFMKELDEMKEKLIGTIKKDDVPKVQHRQVVPEVRLPNEAPVLEQPLNQ